MEGIEELKKCLSYIRYYTENVKEKEEIIEFLACFADQLKALSLTKESELPPNNVEFENIGEDYLLRLLAKSKVGYIYKGDRLVAEIMLK
jgi:hypothetical protein